MAFPLDSIPRIVARQWGKHREEKARELLQRALPNVDNAGIDLWVDLTMRKVAELEEIALPV